MALGECGYTLKRIRALDECGYTLERIRAHEECGYTLEMIRAFVAIHWKGLGHLMNVAYIGND